LGRFWSRVNRHTTTPVNAVWLVVGFCTCLNLIGLGSSQTIFSIFNITAPALDLSYVAVVLCRRIYEHKVPFIEGPFTLGRWGPFINYTAVCWVFFISVVLFFPPLKPVTAANMNYAICVAAVIAVVSMAWWFISARQCVVSHFVVQTADDCSTYTGPRTKEIIIAIPTDDPEFLSTLDTGLDDGDL
jgi:amino acid transporter